MPHSLDQLLPSLQALGVWTYWILGLFALFEAIVFTGIAVPGMIAVIAGGILVQRGVLDYLDLGWFIFAATVLGSELSPWTPGRKRPEPETGIRHLETR